MGQWHRPSDEIEVTEEEIALLAQKLREQRPDDPEQPWLSIEGLAEIRRRAVEAERKAEEEYEAAVQRYNRAARAFHDAVQGAKAEVLRQYGVDSPEYASVAGNQRARRRIAQRGTKRRCSS